MCVYLLLGRHIRGSQSASQKGYSYRMSSQAYIFLYWVDMLTCHRLGQPKIYKTKATGESFCLLLTPQTQHKTPKASLNGTCAKESYAPETAVWERTGFMRGSTAETELSDCFLIRWQKGLAGARVSYLVLSNDADCESHGIDHTILQRSWAWPQKSNCELVFVVPTLWCQYHGEVWWPEEEKPHNWLAGKVGHYLRLLSNLDH